MWFGIPLFPERASTLAWRVDALYFFVLAVTVFFSLLIAGLVIFCMVKYRRRSPDAVGIPATSGLKTDLLEAGWTVIPLLITLVIFVWGASVFFAMASPPGGAINVYVVGKQWMWKVQHADGQREIDELHVPVGRPVRLIMTSEDVIHAFFVPVFRVKADVIPGRYTEIWFTATKTGR
jgi:cytochrome c oxidase subunit 2